MVTDPEHPTRTRRSGHRYIFTSKHHGGGSADDARWSDEVSRDEEFSIFDGADNFEIADDDGRMYGVLRDSDGELRDIGTWQQQIAEFPRANAGVPWHGYPIWSVNDDAPPNAAGQKVRPAKTVFLKMELAGLITERQRKRLLKGAHV